MRFVEVDFDLLSKDEKRKITLLRGSLLSWYAENGRRFPWRRDGVSQYERICVEVLLQRTRAQSVSSVYKKFFEEFACWDDLNEAPNSKLESAFQPLGLWRQRAKSIKGLAEYAAKRGGKFPADRKELATVPGIGHHICNAILLFQHGQPAPLVDVNLARLVERYVKPRKLADLRYDPWLQAAAHWLVRKEPVKTNWAVLDFAALVCKTSNPSCSDCRLANRCRFLAIKGRFASA